MHMVPSDSTYHMHAYAIDGDIMKHNVMNMARLRLLFVLYTIITVCSVGV